MKAFPRTSPGARRGAVRLMVNPVEAVDGVETKVHFIQVEAAFVGICADYTVKPASWIACFCYLSGLGLYKMQFLQVDEPCFMLRRFKLQLLQVKRGHDRVERGWSGAASWRLPALV